MMEKIKILICDDHAIVLEGLRTVIQADPGMELIGEASDGVEAVRLALILHPDIILIDLVMANMNGIEAIRKIIGQDPHAHILVLTSFSDDALVFPAIKSGALGYLLKDSSPEQLIQSIHEVHRGEPSLHPRIALKMIRELSRPADLPPTTNPLTEREVAVLRLVAQGLTNQEIAIRLDIREWTVRTHVRNIFSKLHLANRTQATLYAIREGYSDPQKSES
jgi:two-component system, NarL family, response regulator LiaR